MLERTVRYVVWTGGKWYVKRRATQPLKVMLALGVVTVAVTAYVVTRGDDDQQSP